MEVRDRYGEQAAGGTGLLKQKVLSDRAQKAQHLLRLLCVYNFGPLFNIVIPFM